MVSKSGSRPVRHGDRMATGLEADVCPETVVRRRGGAWLLPGFE